MSKNFAIGLLILALSLAQIACSKSKGEKPANGGMVQIQCETGIASDSLEKLSEEFTKETGIKIEILRVSPAEFKIRTDAELRESDSVFDLVIGDSAWLGEEGSNGFLVELTDWMNKEIALDDFEPAALQWLYQFPSGSGRYFAAPALIDPLGVLYRKDWFQEDRNRALFKAKYGRELAPPEDWDQFRDLAEFFVRPAANPPLSGVTLPTGQGSDDMIRGIQLVIWSCGGDYSDPQTGKAHGILDSASAIKALKFYAGLIRYAPPGGNNADANTVIHNFESETVAMAMDYFSLFPETIKKMGDKVGVFRVPGKRQADGSVTRVISARGLGLAIPKNASSAKVVSAKKFIKWFCQPISQKKWANLPGGFSASKSALADPHFLKAAIYNRSLADSARVVRDFPSGPSRKELFAPAQELWGKAILGTLPADEAMHQLAARFDAVYSKAKSN